MENNRVVEPENCLNGLVEKLKCDAYIVANAVNFCAQVDNANGNRTQYGSLTHALKTLQYLGLEATHDTWECEGMLIVEKVTVKGEVIYERTA